MTPPHSGQRQFTIADIAPGSRGLRWNDIQPSLFAVHLLIAGRLGSVDQRAAVQASNLETVREFGMKHGGVLIRLIVSNGANVLGRQKNCQANVCCRAADSEEFPKRV